MDRATLEALLETIGNHYDKLDVLGTALEFDATKWAISFLVFTAKLGDTEHLKSLTDILENEGWIAGDDFKYSEHEDFIPFILNDYFQGQ